MEMDKDKLFGIVMDGLLFRKVDEQHCDSSHNVLYSCRKTVSLYEVYLGALLWATGLF